ncbi:hypothetical protein EGI31_19515 [Lacihabitans soyangensis]|uniref:Uncharacterized protein n=2 Tax=Lacihabitans soyangensis TaxID=869394 RepID=A0AAE3KUK0_9BACT|nr:hypothetical protein [Lacihabitans soyangensis]
MKATQPLNKSLMLIKNEAELKSVLGGVQQSITWETFESFVKQAELKYIVPAISESFYDELCELYEPNVYQQKIIDRLMIASGYYALVAALPQLVTVIGDNGIAVNNTGGSPMYKWTYKELKDSSLEAADEALEQALVWLEKNQNAEVSTGVKVFQKWIDSDECSISKSLYINDASEFTAFFPQARHKRRFYLNIREYLVKVEKHELLPQLGKAFFDALRNGDESNYAIAEAKAYAKYFLAYKAVSEAIPFLNINEDFRLINADQYSLIEGEYALDANRRNALQATCDDRANWYLKKLKWLIDKNASASVFPTYFNSEEYKVSSTTKGYFRAKNDPSKSYVTI